MLKLFNLFRYCELIPKDKFSELPRDRLEEELSIVTKIIEEIPTAEQYDNIHTNRNRILEALANPLEGEAKYYLIQSPRHETDGTKLYGAFSLRQAQRLMVKLAVKDGTEDEEPQDFDNWNLDTMNYYLSIVTLAGTDCED